MLASGRAHPGAVEELDLLLDLRGELRRERLRRIWRILTALLVAQRPPDHGRVVPIPQNQRLDVLDDLADWVRFKAGCLPCRMCRAVVVVMRPVHPVLQRRAITIGVKTQLSEKGRVHASGLVHLIPHQHALAVGGVKELRIRGIVRAAPGVSAHLLQRGDAILVDAIGHGDAAATEILMVAQTLHCHVLIVQKEPLVRVKSQPADAKCCIDGVLRIRWRQRCRIGRARLLNCCEQRVERRALYGPKARRADVDQL
eukprot:COSAG04_NODE_557_length_12649_cov_45.850251_3_plen_256_part_00